MEVVKPKVYLEKLDVDVPVYHSGTGEKEPVIVPLVLSEYSFNFTDYRDGVGGYLQFANNDRIITGWLDFGADKKIGSLEKLLVRFGVPKIKR